MFTVDQLRDLPLMEDAEALGSASDVEYGGSTRNPSSIARTVEMDGTPAENTEALRRLLASDDLELGHLWCDPGRQVRVWGASLIGDERIKIEIRLRHPVHEFTIEARSVMKDGGMVTYTTLTTDPDCTAQDLQPLGLPAN